REAGIAGRKAAWFATEAWGRNARTGTGPCIAIRGPSDHASSCRTPSPGDRWSGEGRPHATAPRGRYSATRLASSEAGSHVAFRAPASLRGWLCRTEPVRQLPADRSAHPNGRYAALSLGR